MAWLLIVNKQTVGGTLDILQFLSVCDCVLWHFILVWDWMLDFLGSKRQMPGQAEATFSPLPLSTSRLHSPACPLPYPFLPACAGVCAHCSMSPSHSSTPPSLPVLLFSYLMNKPVKKKKKRKEERKKEKAKNLVAPVLLTISPPPAEHGHSSYSLSGDSNLSAWCPTHTGCRHFSFCSSCVAGNSSLSLSFSGSFPHTSLSGAGHTQQA